MNQEERDHFQAKIEDSIADYIEEWIMPKLDALINERLIEMRRENTGLRDSVASELIYETLKMIGQLEDRIQISKKSFWKWWK